MYWAGIGGHVTIDTTHIDETNDAVDLLAVNLACMFKMQVRILRCSSSTTPADLLSETKGSDGRSSTDLPEDLQNILNVALATQPDTKRVSTFGNNVETYFSTRLGGTDGDQALTVDPSLHTLAMPTIRSRNGPRSTFSAPSRMVSHEDYLSEQAGPSRRLSMFSRRVLSHDESDESGEHILDDSFAPSLGRPDSSPHNRHPSVAFNETDSYSPMSYIASVEESPFLGRVTSVQEKQVVHARLPRPVPDEDSAVLSDSTFSAESKVDSPPPKEVEAYFGTAAVMRTRNSISLSSPTVAKAVSFGGVDDAPSAKLGASMSDGTLPRASFQDYYDLAHARSQSHQVLPTVSSIQWPDPSVGPPQSGPPLSGPPLGRAASSMVKPVLRRNATSAVNATDPSVAEQLGPLFSPDTILIIQDVHLASEAVKVVLMEVRVCVRVMMVATLVWAC